MLTKHLFHVKTCKNLVRLGLRGFSSTADIKKLREHTGSPLGECKTALEQAGGDFEKAKEWLREQGSAYADK